MGPVISASACKSILEYIETGKGEGRLLLGGKVPAQGEGYFIPPTIIADVDPKARIFQEEVFGPVLAVTKVHNFAQSDQSLTSPPAKTTSRTLSSWPPAGTPAPPGYVEP